MYIPTNSFFNFNNILLIPKKYTEILESSIGRYFYYDQPERCASKSPLAMYS